MLYKFKILLFCLIILAESKAQFSFNLTTITNLNSVLDETSGLIVVNGKIWTHNDSGSSNKIYQVDTTNGQILRTIIIGNIPNVDWEDIAQDQDYIYIGDFGNNLGTRTNLAIYKILKTHIENSTNDTVYAETISYSYSDQTDFTAAQYSTNFDCEAFICIDTSLILFTKMWGMKWTKSYQLPNVSGTHIAMLTDSFNVDGLITGADVDTSDGSVCLLGYTFGWPSTPFVWKFDGFSGCDIFSGNNEKIEFMQENIQLEGIANISEGNYILSSEKGSQSAATLFSLPLNMILDKKHILKGSLDVIPVFPNPSSGIIQLQFDQEHFVEIYDISGASVFKKTFTHRMPIDLSFLKKGCYLIKIETKDFIVKEKIILN